MIGAGVYIYIVCGQKKLNRTLAIDSPFQTFAVGLLVKVIYRLALSLHGPETLSSSTKSRIFLYNVHLALFVQMDDTITHTKASISIVN